MRTTYTTDSGKTFDTPEECLDYEARVSRVDSFVAEVRALASGNLGEPIEMHNTLTLHVGEVRFRRLLPHTDDCCEVSHGGLGWRRDTFAESAAHLLTYARQAVKARESDILAARRMLDKANATLNYLTQTLKVPQ